MSRMAVSIGRMRGLLAGLMVLVASCSGSNGGNNGSDGGGDGVVIRDDAGRVVGNCSDTNPCKDGQVCHPYTHLCTMSGTACEDHSTCPEDTYCEPSLGVCLGAALGTPCDGDAHCNGTCTGGVCGCDCLTQERALASAPLDVYLILDRTGSMGRDCNYRHGNEPPVSSKACFATYAISDYLIDNVP